MSAANAMPPKKLRILCFGASLVAGYSSNGAVYHPFSHHVVKMLSMIMPAADIETVVDGLPGDRVTTGLFLERMQSHFTENSEPFDWTIVLGATKYLYSSDFSPILASSKDIADFNFPSDIAFFMDVDVIMDKLKEVWKVALSHGSKVLALTVPRAAIDANNQPLVQKRNALNQRIKDHKEEGFHVFDLHDALPYDAEHAKYWDDAIHFTPDGYDAIGDKVGVALMALMVAERTKGS